MPTRVTIVGVDGAQPGDAPLRLCAPHAPSAMGPRTGTEPWPEGAVLVLGTDDPPRTAILTALTHAMAPWIAVASAAITAAALELFLRP